MQFTQYIALLFLAAVTLAKNILLTNDDSWVATNIRATYYKLKEAGHEVWLVAPVSQRSGWGGRFDVPTSPTLQTDGELGYVKAGAPSWGHEDFDDHIWYFNGTPASSVAFALQYVFPVYFNLSDFTPDFVVSGPNEGTNLGSFYTLSGTMGATYNSVYRNLPAIAFSGSNSNNSLYTDFLDLSDPLEPSTIYAGLVVDIVNTIFEAQGDNERALPLGVGYNVNFPAVGYQNESCTAPEWVSTRFSGLNAAGADMVYNATSDSFVWTQHTWEALTACYNGNCALPSETYINSLKNCQTTVSVFSIDYSANADLTAQSNALLAPIFSK
ncbi:acid phosphatase [Scheffersomyces coipomensis]|uniref:acid phosphatase n=1 Tax=Scheffersomyces coipomensis TaxID=1788519 RepID=UPI00315CACA4